MLIVADENMPLLDEFWSDLGRIRRLGGRAISPVDVKDADVLLVRSVTRVDRDLLAGARPRFVGTATIGTDHVDLGYLAARGIPCASAPGCNALAVAEYVATVLVLHSAKSAFRMEGLRLGVVGCGQVGGRVVERARALGISCAVCDPFLPVQALSPDVPLVGLDALLEWADVLSLHVPLTRDGKAPTWHLFDHQRLKGGRWTLLINTARGQVIDNEALLDVLRADPGRQVVLDVWEDEPLIRPALLEKAWLGTPHVAGYSIEGKWRGTAMLRAAAAKVLGVSEGPDLQSVSQALGDRPRSLDWQGSLAATLETGCPVRRDDASLRRMVAEAGDSTGMARGFDLLRKHYPDRREFPHYRIRGAPLSESGILAGLGFGIEV